MSLVHFVDRLSTSRLSSVWAPTSFGIPTTRHFVGLVPWCITSTDCPLQGCRRSDHLALWTFWPLDTSLTVCPWCILSTECVLLYCVDRLSTSRLSPVWPPNSFGVLTTRHYVDLVSLVHCVHLEVVDVLTTLLLCRPSILLLQLWTEWPSWGCQRSDHLTILAFSSLATLLG